MKKLLIGMLIVGSVLAAVALILKRRSGSQDDWGSFAQDSYSWGSEAASKVAEVGKESVSKATEAVKTTASKAADAAKDA